MNAVEIEAAISELALQPFDAAEFPYAFLSAFGNKDTTLKRLRTGNNNASDVPGGVLQRNNVHIAVCEAGTVGETLKALRAGPSTTKAKAKFILATDGQTLEAEELASGETIACAYPDFPNHFGFFLPLAGISTIKEIKDNPIDVRATGRLTEQNKVDLTACAEDILLPREAHFPANIAELYDPDNMPDNLRRAHARNDEVLERIYIGRRFKNDTERLEKLFELYTKMTAAAAKAKPTTKATRTEKAS
jgi:hypothetical protein